PYRTSARLPHQHRAEHGARDEGRDDAASTERTNEIHRYECGESRTGEDRRLDWMGKRPLSTPSHRRCPTEEPVTEAFWGHRHMLPDPGSAEGSSGASGGLRLTAPGTMRRPRRGC